MTDQPRVSAPEATLTPSAIASADLLAAAKDLSGRQFRRLLRAMTVQAEASSGTTRSSLGRVVRGARTERKLVLFTLGIIVMLIVIAVFVLAYAGKADTLSTPLVTLAGTGLGFIGGLVQREADVPAGSTDSAA